jgi:hypothetical protein
VIIGKRDALDADEYSERDNDRREAFQQKPGHDLPSLICYLDAVESS